MFEVSDPPTYSGDRVHSSPNQHLVNKIMSSPISYDLQGQGGGVVITSSSGSVSGDYRWLQVVNDAVFSSLVSENITDISDLEGVTIPAGVGLGGRFSEIELSSGIVIAYLS